MVEGGDWDGIKQGMPEFYEATQKTHPVETSVIQKMLLMPAFFQRRSEAH